MAENKLSSEGLLEDLMRTMVQLTCAELHEKTNIERLNADLELGEINLQEFDELEPDYIANLEQVTALRRTTTKLIFDIAGGKGNEKKWCLTKHVGAAMYTAFEAWQASDNDMALYDLYLNINQYFIKVMTEFMGLPVISCASCLTDILKAVTSKEDDLNGM